MGSTARPIQLSPEEQRALAEKSDLTEAEKRRFIDMRRRVHRSDANEILGLEPGATRREIDVALRCRGREFDLAAFGRKRLGVFGDWLGDILAGINAAYLHLCFGAPMPEPRRAEPKPPRPRESVATGSVQAPADPFTAARQALGAGDLDKAETLARAAVDRAPDLDSLRLLAEVYRRQDLLDRAIGILELALGRSRTPNQVRTVHNELAALRKLKRRA